MNKNRRIKKCEEGGRRCEPSAGLGSGSARPSPALASRGHRGEGGRKATGHRRDSGRAPEPGCSSAALPSTLCPRLRPVSRVPPRRDSAHQQPPDSVPARKRGRRGGGAWKRFRGRGARAGAAAGAAGKGLAPAAAAEGAPRAGDVNAARGPGEAGGSRAEAAGSGRPVERLSGSSWVRRGGRDAVWSVRGTAGRGPEARAPAGGQALGSEG